MYTHFYGFSEEPFRDTPDPRFLFAVPGHERALNCLRQGIEENNGWVLLSGEAGSGKTILIRSLLPHHPAPAHGALRGETNTLPVPGVRREVNDTHDGGPRVEGKMLAADGEFLDAHLGCRAVLFEQFRQLFQF